MWAKRVAVGVFAAMTTLSAVTACSHYGQAAGDIAPSNAIAVQVHNDNFLDMDVFAVSQGVATRLGTVSGTGSRTFVMDASLATPGLRVIATPIGGSGRASSGSLSVAPGQTIEFRIGTLLSNSTVFIK